MATPKPPSDYTVLHQNPTPEQYTHLRTIAHLTPPPPTTDLTTALSLSTFSILIQHSPSDTIIGMGRLIGDTYLFLQIVDIAIDPAHQKKGLGNLIMGELVGWVDKHAPDAYVSLVAERGAQEWLYPKFGFADVRPSVGMYRCERVRRRRAGLGIV